MVAASAIAGYITTPDDIPDEAVSFMPSEKEIAEKEIKIHKSEKVVEEDRPTIVEGRVWYIKEDNIDTDMIFHNRYLTITDINEMGQYAFDNLAGYEDFAKKVKETDMVIVHKNFGSGSSRQQAVDCFKALGVSVIMANSFGAIYERNAINAAFPIMNYSEEMAKEIDLEDGDILQVNFENGEVINKTKNKSSKANPFYEVQLEIYRNGGIF